MDSVERYSKIVIKLIEEYASIPSANEPDVHDETLFDKVKNRYLLLSLGWSRQQRRIHYVVIHIDIVDQQVWIQANNTDRLIAEDLVECGIPRGAIVLGMQPPEIWPYTAYGVPSEGGYASEPMSA